jgi:glycosyltransferase involved in cell wall biosynthesis
MGNSILMLAENPIPAGKRVSRPHYLAEALAESGFEVRTITYRSERVDAIPGCKHRYLPFRFEQFSFLRRMLFLSSFFYALREILGSRPTALHGQGFLPGLVTAFYSRLFDIPCIVGMPDFVETLYESFNFPFAGVASGILTILENLIARSTSALIVESELAKGEWIRRGVDAKRIHAVHHAADIALFDPRTDGDKVRKEYTRSGELLISYHGDIGSDDGVDVLVQAFASIATENPSVILMIIGSGAETTMSELRQLASGVQDRVIFTGWIPYREIPSYIAASDIGVAPFRSTLYTNTVVPTKVLEIMAMKKPAIVSDLTTFGQYVSDRQHCLLVEPGSVKDLTHALVQLVENPQLRESLGENGRRLVEEKFTWTIKTNEEIDVIRTIIRR